MKKCIIFLLSILLLVGCQPTPETEFVSHRDTEEMLEKAASGLDPINAVGADMNGELPDVLNEDVCDGTIGVMQFEDDGKTYTRYGFHAISHDDQPRLIFHLDIPGQEEINSHRLEDTLLNYHNCRSALTGGEGDVDVHTPKIGIRNPDNPMELAEYPFITYTPAQAMADTEAFFASAGLPEIKADSVVCYPDTKSEQCGYRVNCVRTVAGVRNAYLGGMMSGGIAAPLWKYESISVCIDEQGVYELSWYAPLGVKEIVLPASNLLPFDEIVKRFIRQVWIEEKPWLILDESLVVEDDYPSDMHMEITRVTLSLQRVMEKNKFDSGLLVPVWNFYGATVTTRTNVRTRETYEEQHYRYADNSPILSINAVDGNIIDLYKGY